MQIRAMTLPDCRSWRWLTQSLWLTDSSTQGTAAYIQYCFITSHTIWVYVCSINHSSLLMYWLLCALFQPLIMSKLIRGTLRLPCCCMGGPASGSPCYDRHLADSLCSAHSLSNSRVSWNIKTSAWMKKSLFFKSIPHCRSIWHVLHDDFFAPY